MNDIGRDYSIESIDTIKEYIMEGDSYTSGENIDYNKALISYGKAKKVAYSLLRDCDEETRERIHEQLGIIYRKIGDLYFYGHIGERVDYDMAIDCYKYGDLYKDERAKLTLSQIYYGTYVIPEYYNRDKGIRYLKELADAGCYDAQLTLGGIMLSSGQDIDEAEKCFKKCGSEYGMYIVGTKKHGKN